MSTGKRLDRIADGLAILTLLLFIAGLAPEARRDVVFLPKSLRPTETPTQNVGSLELDVSSVATPLAPECQGAVVGSASVPAPPLAANCWGEPVAGASLRAYLENKGSYYPVGSTISDTDGVARLDELPLGDYWIVVDAPGKARRSVQLTLGSEALTVRLLLEPARLLKVRVVDSEGKPISGATVLGTGTDPLPFGALSDAAGQVRLDRLGPSPWRVSVNARGYDRVTRSDVIADLQVTLRRLNSLLVHVVDGEGQPVPAATVFIVGANLWPARQATTDAGGSARISGLAEGVYDLRAQDSQRISLARLGVAVGPGGDDDLTLRLLPGRFVTVEVVSGEDETAEPVAGADVILVENGISPFPWEGRSDKKGRVTLGPVPKGQAMVAAHADGFIGRPVVPVPEDLEGPLRVALRRGGTITGEVLDQNGHAIDGASLEVIGMDLDGLPIADTPFSAQLRSGHFESALAAPQPLVAAGDLGVMAGPLPGVSGNLGAAPQPLATLEPKTNGDQWVTEVGGDFKLYPVTPGHVRVIVRHPSYIEAVSEVVALEPGGEAQIKIVMLEGASLQGRVLDDAGLPVAGARIELTPIRGTSRLHATTLGDGTFAFAAVPAEISLSLARPSDPGQFVLRKTLHLSNEEHREIELVLPAEREAVTLTVVGDRQPIAGAQVAIVSLDPEVPLRQALFTDAQGQVKMPDAAGLGLSVHIEASGFGKYQQAFDHAPTEINAELAAGILVEGTVTAVRGRQSLEGARVTVLAEGARQSTQTDARGAYRFTDLNPGQVKLIISHPDYATVERVVELASTGRSDRAFDIDPIDLSEAGSVSGVVLDEAGNPVAGARVSLGVAPSVLPTGALPPGMAVTNGRGEFKLANLEPGRVSLGAYAADVGRGTVGDVEIRAGDTTSDVRITLSAAASDGDSPAAAGLAVTLAETTSSKIRQILIVQVAAGSEAERAGLQTGDVIITIDGEPPSSFADASTRLAGPENSDVLLELQRGGQPLKLRVHRQSLQR